MKRGQVDGMNWVKRVDGRFGSLSSGSRNERWKRIKEKDGLRGWGLKTEINGESERE